MGAAEKAPSPKRRREGQGSTAKKGERRRDHNINWTETNFNEPKLTQLKL